MTDQDRTELKALRAEVFALRRKVDAVAPATPVIERAAWEPTEEQMREYKKAQAKQSVLINETESRKDLIAANAVFGPMLAKITNQRDDYKGHLDDLCRMVCELCEMLGDDRHKNPCDAWRLAELIGKQGRESAAFKERAQKAEADLAREQRLHNESRRLHADTIQKAQLLGHAHAKTAERLHRLRTRYRENLERFVKGWRERAEKAEAALAQLAKESENA